MNSFFFVPGNRLHKIEAIQKLNVSEIVIDLEDAVKVSEREVIIEDLITTSAYTQFFIRIPLYTSAGHIDTSVLNKLYRGGYRKFIFPKIQAAADFKEIYTPSDYQDVNIVLLVEHARFFLEAKDVLLQYPEIFTGIGVGSHDFMAEIGGIHNLQNLEYIRLQILYLARMIHIKAIDIASMELKDEEQLKAEIIDGFQKGYDSKFFIHPWQINVFRTIPLYSEKELDWANKIIDKLRKVGSSDEFNPIIVAGQIIERPHLAKAEKIIKYYASK